MKHDPFKEMEKKMREMMEKGMSEGRSISVKQTGEGTTVAVSGNVPDEEIDRLKKRYPDAEIRIDGKPIEEEKGPIIEVIEEENEEESS